MGNRSGCGMDLISNRIYGNNDLNVDGLTLNENNTIREMYKSMDISCKIKTNTIFNSNLNYYYRMIYHNARV
jgi:hypothetical protein